MHRIRVATDGWNFEDEAGAPFTPFGGNVLNDVHPVKGTLFDRFDADDVERRFAAMQSIGLNTLRQPIGVNHVFDAATGLKADGMRHWETFIGLAERYGVRLMPVGGYLGSNDWFDGEILVDDGAPLDDACAFWRAFCGAFTDHPAIFAWDIRNETLYDQKQHDLVGSGTVSAAQRHLTAGWPAFLQARYGTVALMNAAYGAWGGFTDFAGVPAYIGFHNDPGHPVADDFKHYLNAKGFRWSERQVDAIRAASPRTMVCSGNNGWLFPDMDLWLANGFHNRAHHALYDFISIHPYPAPQCQPGGHGDPLNGGAALAFWLDAVVGMARLDYYHKPVVLQEFGWYGGGESRFLGPLPYRSEAEHAAYTRTLITHLLPHANGFINWPLCDMPDAGDISNHGGLFTHDVRPKALAAVYADLAAAHAATRKTRQPATAVKDVSLRLVHTSRAYQDALWEEIHAAAQAGAVWDYRYV
jgi:hypothetical protein